VTTAVSFGLIFVLALVLLQYSTRAALGGAAAGTVVGMVVRANQTGTWPGRDPWDDDPT